MSFCSSGYLALGRKKVTNYNCHNNSNMYVSLKLKPTQLTHSAFVNNMVAQNCDQLQIKAVKAPQIIQASSLQNKEIKMLNNFASLLFKQPSGYSHCPLLKPCHHQISLQYKTLCVMLTTYVKHVTATFSAYKAIYI